VTVGIRQLINRKLLTHLRVLLTHLLFALVSGTITSVILVGALIVGLASMASFLDIKRNLLPRLSMLVLQSRWLQLRCSLHPCLPQHH